MTRDGFFRPEALLADMATVLPTNQDGDTTSLLSSSLDAIALFVHACMRTAGFRLLGFSEDQDSKIGMSTFTSPIYLNTKLTPPTDSQLRGRHYRPTHLWRARGTSKGRVEAVSPPSTLPSLPNHPEYPSTIMVNNKHPNPDFFPQI